MCHFGEGEISIWEAGVAATGTSLRPWMSYGLSCAGVAVPVVLVSSSDWSSFSSSSSKAACRSTKIQVNPQ